MKIYRVYKSLHPRYLYIAYGDMVGSCHLEDEPAYTTFTLFTLAHSATTEQPPAFTLKVSAGSSNDGWTLLNAAK